MKLNDLVLVRSENQILNLKIISKREEKIKGNRFEIIGCIPFGLLILQQRFYKDLNPWRFFNEKTNVGVIKT